MNRVFRYVLASTLAGGLTAVALAQAKLPPPAMDVKMGLWEMTTTMDVGNAMASMMDTSKMTPEQKARMEAMMKQMAGPHTSTNKRCLTKEEMSKGFAGDEGGETCKDTVVTNTSSVYELRRECTGERAESTVVHFESAGRELVKGTVNSKITKNGQSSTVTGTITGKWLSANCGDVK